MNRPVLTAVGVLVLCCVALFSRPAYAHYPTLTCHVAADDAAQLVCVAGYSDASPAGVVELKVYSYSETLLSTVNTAADGSVTLPMPVGEFYIVFDPGHESPAEFDFAEL